MKEIRLFFKLIYMHMLSTVEYKGWWLMLLHVLFYVLLEPLGTILMFLRFGSIGKWTMNDLLVYSHRRFFGIRQTYFAGI
jgi:ABC-2 type transport system permease protein